MAASALSKKLQMKPGNRAVVFNAPEGYIELLEPLPAHVTLDTNPSGNYDFVHIFAANSQELGKLWQTARNALTSGGALWISYPKKSSGLETDLTRDVGWTVVTSSGFRSVRQVSISNTWSAVRFRPVEHKDPKDAISAQYAGKKSDLFPIYKKLVEIAGGFGEDIELAPRKTYVALVRRRQFAVIKPSTSTRLDLGLKLKGMNAHGRLESGENLGSGSITHKVALYKLEDINGEVTGWLKQAYDGVE